MPPKKGKEPSVPMPSGGHAPNTMNAKKNVLRIANLFLAHVADVSPELTAKWGTDFEAVPEQYAADMEIYSHIATYLVKNYIIEEGCRNAGGTLKNRVAMQDWSEMILIQKERFSKSTEQTTKVRRARAHGHIRTVAPLTTCSALLLRQDFFACTKGDKTTEVGLWWSNMRTNLNRHAFNNNVFGPNKIDDSPSEIYLSHVVALMKGLSKANTPESAERKFAIMTLWRMAGRAGEPAFLSYEGTMWNALHETACIECVQVKSSKLKFVPFVAGSSRHKDWLLAFADDLVLKRGDTLYDSNEKTWMLPCLQDCSKP